MKILITGGTGFIGSHVVETLLRDGHTVKVLSTSSSIHPNLKRVADQIEILRGNFGNEVLMTNYLDQIDILIHLAWTTVPKDASDNPIYDAQSNLVGGLHLLEACVKAKIKKLVFISTGGALYGRPDYTPVDELHPLRPISAYGISKMTFERYLYFYYKNRGLDYTVLRLSNVYGPRQNLSKKQGVIGIWLDKIIRHEPIEIWGDGQVVRDYIHVNDVAEALSLLLQYAGGYKIFNLGSGHGVSLNQILSIAKDLSDDPVKISYLPSRSFDVKVNILDSSRITEALNWKSQISLDAGIKTVWDWLKSK
ncbi:MAG: NAD-dependent epimerase/dehydratase family protein [Saprospiraceae bacterium]|nr:NAD-dependent epimerase/dehydratase family protein [Saprospiraceae bacterium]